MTRTRTALVIGGGIAGPVAAMALRRAGITATVYEAYPEPSDGVGAGLSIAPNGQDALAVVGLADAVREIGAPMRALVFESWNGRRLGELGSTPGLPSTRFVWRADLYRVLREAAARQGVAPVYGKRLVSVQDGPDAVRATFADGTQAEADILIGADGIRSSVRPLIDPAAPDPRYAGLLGFGGVVPTTGLASTNDAMHMSFGRRAFLGYQVYEDGSGGWFVNLPHPEPMTTAQARQIDGAEWMRRIRHAFAQDRTPALRLFAGTDPGALMIAGPVESIGRVPCWHRGRMVLVGDAAHATSPSSGQGASLALESAVQLARCLRDLPPDRAFAAYEGLRRDRVERIMRMAARTNRNKAAGPVGRLVRDAVLPLAMRFAKPERMAWQFEHHIDWDAPVADAAAVPAPAR